MCKAPKAPEVKDPKKPQFLRNKYLDGFLGDSAAVQSLRTGRSSLRIPQAADTAGTPPPNPANVAPAGGDFRPTVAPIGGRRGGRPSGGRGARTQLR